jgi:hypothetical protein
MLLSYALTVCNEVYETKTLIDFILKYKRPQDEICVLLDKPKCPNELLDILYGYSSKDLITLKESAFQGHFADWKNELNRMCKGDFIVNLDADEIPSQEFMSQIPEFILYNPDVDLYFVPRENKVEGITQEHILKWGWRIDSKDRINYPDNQSRIFKNNPQIKWVNKVHEVMTGYKTMAFLPEQLCLYHYKNIDRQEKQNQYYSEL